MSETHKDEWVVTRHRVIYGDTDAMGVVYYGTYMRFLEIGRAEYLRTRGKAYREVEQAGYLMPVAEVGLKYLDSARYDDVLEIAARLADLRKASVRFEYRLTRQRDGALIAKGFTRHACIDTSTGGVVRLPDELVDLLGGSD